MRLAVFFVFLLLLFLTAPSRSLAIEDLRVEICGGESFPTDYKADFYIVTTYGNHGRVDAEITSFKIYHGGKFVTDLTELVKPIDVGFFWVQYMISKSNAEGVYIIIVEAKYGLVNASAIRAFTVSNSLKDLNSRLSSVESEIEALKTNVMLSLNSMTETLASIEDRLGYIEEEIDKIENRFDSVSISIANVTSYLADLNETSEDLRINLNELRLDLQNLKSNLISLTTQISNIKEETSTIKESISEYATRAQQSTTKISENLIIILIISLVSAGGAILGFLAIIELGKLLNEKFRLID